MSLSRVEEGLAMHPDFQSAGHAKHFHYRPAVDGLRGVAVLAVLGFHAFPETVTGGYVGVDVFFVISGFLITSIIARQLLHADFSFADFYWRRVRRLFPALILVLATTLALGWFLLLPNEFEQLGKHATAAAAFLANFALWRESGYFDTAAEFKPLLHLWSLGIEEQFYLVWPAILVALWSRKNALLVMLDPGARLLRAEREPVAIGAGREFLLARVTVLGAGRGLSIGIVDGERRRARPRDPRPSAAHREQSSAAGRTDLDPHLHRGFDTPRLRQAGPRCFR